MRLHHGSFLVAALAAGALSALAPCAQADVPNPVRIAVIFERAGKPYSGPVRFTITCYGYAYPPGPDPQLAPGSYTPKPVYSLSGACAGPGCTVDEDLYLNYRHLDRCDLQGDASGVRFQVKDYAQTPIDFGTCGAPASSDYRRPCELRVAIPEEVALPAAPQGAASSTGRSYAVDFLIVLVVTLLVELPILWVLARGLFKLTRVPARRLLRWARWDRC